MAMRLSFRYESFRSLTPSFIASLLPLPCPRLRCFVPALLAVLCLLLYVSGFCKAELIAYLPDRATWLTRASLLWVVGGVATRHPTPQQLQALAVGDRCEVSPRQSKYDATGEVCGDRPVALAYLDVPGNAAKALALTLS
eukprot:1931271-Pleurochrysis_carterae.AAC.2